MSQWNTNGVALTTPLGADNKVDIGSCYLDWCSVLLQHTNLHPSAVLIFCLNACCVPAEMFMWSGVEREHESAKQSAKIIVCRKY